MSGALDLCSAPPRCVDHVLATKRLAEMRKAGSDRGAGRRLRLGDQPAVAPPRCAGARRRPAKQAPDRAVARPPRLRAHAVAHAGGHGRGAAQRPSRARRRRQAERSARASIFPPSAYASPRGCSTGSARDSRSARCSAIASSAGFRKAAIGAVHRAFRELAPLVARKLEQNDQPAGQSVEAIAANNVVDGLALLRAGRTASWTTPPPGNAGTITFGAAVGQQPATAAVRPDVPTARPS